MEGLQSSREKPELADRPEKTNEGIRYRCKGLPLIRSNRVGLATRREKTWPMLCIANDGTVDRPCKKMRQREGPCSGPHNVTARTHAHCTTDDAGLDRLGKLLSKAQTALTISAEITDPVAAVGGAATGQKDT